MTGASGFLGGYFLAEARHRNQETTTLGRRNLTETNHITCDLAAAPPAISPPPAGTLVIHNAGLAHRVPKTEAEKAAFFAVNQTGTDHLLQALTPHAAKLRGFVFISTVAVYGLQEGDQIDESTALNAQDPYGAGKIAAEQNITRWGTQHGVPVWNLRLPLIAGGDPPGNLGAMIQAIRAGYYCRIGNGGGRRSWVWARDVARLTFSLSGAGGTYNLTDGAHPSFFEIEQGLRKVLQKPRGLVLPRTVARLTAWCGDVIDTLPVLKAPFNSARLQKMEAHLMFDDRRARRALGWNPHTVLEHVHEVFDVG
nr:NAD-dependent epimerase/dehydratase family protein [Acanthopleuribacter pedis]